MFEELLCAGPLVVVFHQAALNEWLELFRPADMRKSLRGTLQAFLSLYFWLLVLSSCLARASLFTSLGIMYLSVAVNKQKPVCLAWQATFLKAFALKWADILNEDHMWQMKWTVNKCLDFLIKSRWDRVLGRSCLVSQKLWTGGLVFVTFVNKERGTHHFLDLSLGAGFLGIRNRALIGCISQRAVGRERRMLTQDVLCCPKPSSRSQPSF